MKVYFFHAEGKVDEGLRVTGLLREAMDRAMEAERQRRSSHAVDGQIDPWITSPSSTILEFMEFMEVLDVNSSKRS